MVRFFVVCWLGACNHGGQDRIPDGGQDRGPDGGQDRGPDGGQDKDTCSQTMAICAPDATCTNTPSGPTCTCNAGYTGDGLTCTNVAASFKKVAPAGGFSCGLAESGAIYCWGNNFDGDLGDGTVVPRTRPVQVGTATDWIDVDARTDVGCGIKTDHSMWCWGFGSSGQLGDGMSVDEYSPTKVISDKPGVGWKAMALGRQRECAIHDDGSLACWGLDRVTGMDVTQPVAVDANTDWTDVAVGTVQCGIRGMPGHLYCWGRSIRGDLGLGSTTTQTTPVQVGTDTWKSVKVGYYNACGIRSDNALLCWGQDPFLSTALRYGNTPQQIGTATDWQSISMSSDGVIGLRAGGNAYAWGNNGSGQLALHVGPEVEQPTPLSGTVTGWSEAKSGNLHGCGIANGQVYCWGALGEGYLGNGTSNVLYSPTKIGSDRWTALAGGAGQCGLRNDGALMCWGNSGVGVGFSNTDPVWAPTRLGANTWSAVAGSTPAALGVSVSCAVRGGIPYCWGDNSYGQLGLGNMTTPQLSPVAVNVPAGTQWTEIAINSHTCAIKSDATLWCWGNNDAGQLGTGAASNTPTTAPSAPLAGAWLHVAVASYDLGSLTCGIKTDHTLWCWGKDQFPALTQHLVPTQVGTDASWASLSMAYTLNNGVTTCAVKMNGTLWCWGAWLGNGTMNPSATPVQVGTATDWKTVAVGGEICATKTAGTLWCWGNEQLLGDGKPLIYDPMTGVLAATTTPTQIGSDADWSTVITGGSRREISCATKTDGSLWCWGLGAAPIPGFVTEPVPVK